MQFFNFSTGSRLRFRPLLFARRSSRFCKEVQQPRFLLPASQHPSFVHHCPVCQHLLPLLQQFAWQTIPGHRREQWFGRYAVPLSSYVAAFFVKLACNLGTMSALRRHLCQHPGLVWALGFQLTPAQTPWGFDPDASLPSSRHFTRVLRELDPALLQGLLTAQVQQLQQRYQAAGFGQVVSMDTKHIVAWVKENNPRVFIKEGRYDAEKQPAGDMDCKVGCKRRRNIKTPTAEGQPASKLSVAPGEFYWGYASGAVVTKVPQVGEFVLAELTQPFDCGDLSYFFPLMGEVEQRLGFRPPFFTADAAYDAFYVYDYFHQPGRDGFAAVPFAQRGGHRLFDEADNPLCAAGLAMSLKMTYNDRTTALIPYRRQQFVCPLLHPHELGEVCLIAHKRWAKGGCKTSLAESVGSRLRHQLDREGVRYKQVYKQRTAVERVFSQAKALGMERPKLRNQLAIANQNTLIYLLINARTALRARDGHGR